MNRRGGSLQAVGMVGWQLRYDLLAVVVVAAAMIALSAVLPLQGAAAVVPLLGVVVLAGSLAAGAGAALAACSTKTAPGTSLTTQPTSVPAALAEPIKAAEAGQQTGQADLRALARHRPAQRHGRRHAGDT